MGEVHDMGRSGYHAYFDLCRHLGLGLQIDSQHDVTGEMWAILVNARNVNSLP